MIIHTYVYRHPTHFLFEIHLVIKTVIAKFDDLIRLRCFQNNSVSLTPAQRVFFQCRREQLLVLMDIDRSERMNITHSDISVEKTIFILLIKSNLITGIRIHIDKIEL